MVREFHTVIGKESREQCAKLLENEIPDVVTACVGGGSNAIGIFSGFADTTAELVGVEPAGGAAVGRGVPGVVHGMKSYLMQDEFGQVQEAHSIAPAPIDEHIAFLRPEAFQAVLEQVLARHRIEAFHAVVSAARTLEDATADVGTRDFPQPGSITQVVVERHRHAVRLLAAGTGSTPDAEGAGQRGLRFQDLLAQEVEVGRFAEEIRFVGGHQIDEILPFIDLCWPIQQFAVSAKAGQ
jgi:hypothetical protein